MTIIFRIVGGLKTILTKLIAGNKSRISLPSVRVVRIIDMTLAIYFGYKPLEIKQKGLWLSNVGYLVN